MTELITPQPTPQANSAKGFFWELIKVVVLSLAIILPVRMFLMQPFIVKGASMEPTFHNREYLVIDKLSYHFSNPGRGDVVVFKVEAYADYLIKRVIGLPGERVVIEEDQVYIFNADNPNGFRLNENYLDTAAVTTGVVDTTLGDDEYFVLGDNRPNSSDSRYFGVVHANKISGRTWLRLLPVSKIDAFPKSFAYEVTAL